MSRRGGGEGEEKGEGAKTRELYITADDRVCTANRNISAGLHGCMCADLEHIAKSQQEHEERGEIQKGDVHRRQDEREREALQALTSRGTSTISNVTRPYAKHWTNRPDVILQSFI